MKKIIAVIIAAGLAACPLSAAFAADGNVPQIVVKYKPARRSLRVASDAGGLSNRNISKYKPRDMAEYTSMLKSLSDDPSVEYAEPVVKYSLMQIPPDPDLEYNWGHAAIGAYRAWDTTTGSSAIKVAVIDSGVDMSDPDLSANLVSGYDFVNRDGDPDNADGAVHATLVSKIIGAQAENTVEGEAWGTAGIAWECSIMPLKIFDDNKPDISGSSDLLAEAVYYAADNGADIINMSLGGPDMSQAVKEALEYAHEKGLLMIASSGNSGDGVKYPAAHKEVMAVGAYGRDGNMEDYSCRGEEISIAAPGQILLRMDRNQPIYKNGTSFSAPYASGAAVLLKSLHRSWTPIELRWAVENSAEDGGAPGWDHLYGSGKLNILAAIQGQSPPAADGNDSFTEKEILQIGDNMGRIQVPLDKDYYGLALDKTTTVKINRFSSVPISLKDGIERWPAGERLLEVGALYGRWSQDPYTITVETLPYGDFDGSRRVDIYDLARLARKTGSQTGSGPGDSIWDGDLDGNIDIGDLNQAAARFGETY